MQQRNNPIEGAIGHGQAIRSTGPGMVERAKELRALERYYREHGDPEVAEDYAAQARQLEAQVGRGA